MNNETDLDWLARNVHEWPAGDHQPWCYVYWKGGHRAVSANCITVIQPCARIEKAEWLARRAELQNKPSWGLVGSDINFISQHEDGQWIGHGEKPEEGAECFEGNCEVAYYGYGEILGDWLDTLEKRPEQDEFEPLTSIEDNQEQDMAQQQEMKQDNGWFERGELPPVDAKVMHMGTATDKDWLEVEIIAHAQRKGCKVAVFEYQGGVSFSSATYFRPVRTERDELIDVLKGTHAASLTNLDMLASAILAAGFSLGAK